MQNKCKLQNLFRLADKMCLRKYTEKILCKENSLTNTYFFTLNYCQFQNVNHEKVDAGNSGE